MNKCMLCESKNINERYPYVRDNKDIKVLECNECGLVFLSSFDHISDEFYENSGMLNGKVDLEKYRQQSYRDDFRRANDLSAKLLGKRVLDFGCGAGGFLNLVKGHTERVCGVELDKTIRKAINNEGVKCYSSIDELEGEYDIITLFHVLEHLVNPIETLRGLKRFLAKNGIIIIEVPNADDALLTLYKSAAFADFTYWSCHTYLYNSFTLKKIAEKSGLSVKMVKQIQRYPLSNHLFWLSERKPGGHTYLGTLDNPILTKEYESALASIGKCDTIMIEVFKEKK